MGGSLSLLILGLAAALQATLIPQITVLGGRPDLVFLLVLTWALNARFSEGLVWAFVGGIMQDLFSAAPTGTSVVSLVILVFAIDAVRRQVYRVGWLLMIWITLIGSFAQQITVMIILYASGFQPALASRFGFDLLLNNLTFVILPTVLYNVIFLFPIYGFVRRVQRRIEGRRISIQGGR